MQELRSGERHGSELPRKCASSSGESSVSLSCEIMRSVTKYTLVGVFRNSGDRRGKEAEKAVTGM